MTQQQLMASAASVFALGGGGPPPDEAWITAWQASGGQSAIAGFDDTTFRNRFPFSALKNIIATKVRVTFKAGSDAMTIDNAFIGAAATTGDPFDFAATPIRLTFNGGDNGSGSVSANGEILSDEINFTYDGDIDLLISHYISVGDAAFFMFASQQQGVVGWKRGGSDDAATVDSSGYNFTEVYYAPYSVVKLEFFGFIDDDPTVPAEPKDPFGDFVTVLLTADGGDKTSDLALSPRSSYNFNTGVFAVDLSGGNYVLQRNDTLDGHTNRGQVQFVQDADADARFFFGNKDFTWEAFFIWSTDTPSDDIFTYMGNGAFFIRRCIRLYIEAGIYKLYMNGQNVGDFNLVSDTQVQAGVRQHITISRVGGTVYMMLDGVIVDSGAFTDILQYPNFADSCNLVNMGEDLATVDDVRVTTGVGRYSANFTPEDHLLPPGHLPKGSDEHYWYRVRITSIQGAGTGGGSNRAALKRALFMAYDEASKPRVILGATGATTSSPLSSGTAAAGLNADNLISGAVGYWDSADTSAMFLGRFFFPPRTVVGVGLMSLGGASKFAPAGFVLEWSDDSQVTWTDILTVTGIGAWNADLDHYRAYLVPEVTYSGSPWGAHANWRAYVIDAPSNSLRAAELEWRATLAGADEAEGSGGTGVQSNTWSTQTPSLAYDSNTGTYAETVSDTAYTDYMGYQFPAPIELAQISWVSQDNIHNPTAGLAFYSDDNTNWYPAFGWVGKAWSAGAVAVTLTDRLFGPPVPGGPDFLIWRILVTANNGNGFVSIGSKLSMFESNDGTGSDVVATVGGTISGSSAGEFGNSLANLLDANDSTQWAATKTGADFIRFDFNSPVDINSFKLKVSTAGGQEALMPLDFKLQYSEDEGDSWQDRIVVTGEDFTTGAAERTFHT